MKPFWKRPAKKKPKTKTKSTTQKRPRPEPWVPPHPEALKKKPENLTVELAKAGENVQKGFDDGVRATPEKKAESGVRTEFLKVFRELSRSHRSIDIWIDFVTMFACAISNSVDKEHHDEREKRYLAAIRKYNKHDQSLFPKLAALTVEALEENPEQDFLGYTYTMLGLADKSKEQIFTPYHVADMMARITMGDLLAQVNENGFVNVNDPCCGGGVTLIAAVNEARRQLEKADLNFQNHILVCGQDIDEVVVMMCYIQISLLGVAGYFKVGNSLTNSMSAEDGIEDYWFTPMYCFSPVWNFRRIFRKVDELTKNPEEGGAE